jgi:succinate dehydrogenase flavin-adding protein (antitoxin of CptAB toxin-antitoxin module)
MPYPPSPERREMANAAFNAANERKLEETYLKMLEDTYDAMLKNFFLTHRTTEVTTLTTAMQNLRKGMKNKMANLTILNDLLTNDNSFLTSLLEINGTMIPEIKERIVVYDDDDVNIQNLENTYLNERKKILTGSDNELVGLTTAMENLKKEMKKKMAKLTTLYQPLAYNNNYLRSLIEAHDINITSNTSKLRFR